MADQAFEDALRVDSIEDAGDDAQLVRAVTPSTLEPGLYDIVVENPDGERARLHGVYTASAAELQAHVLDVGQGAALLVIGPDGSTLLVDGGKVGRGISVVKPALERLANGRLDAVVSTHFDADHLAGLVEVLSGPDGTAGTGDDLQPASGIWDQGDDSACVTQVCDRYRSAAAGLARDMQVGDLIQLGEASARCVAVRGAIEGGETVAVDDENEASIALLIEHAGTSLLVAGDLTGGGLGSVDVETPLARALGHVDVWLLNHHGAETSTAASALALHAPRAAVISVGTDNAYCHPTQSVLDRLREASVPVFMTGAGVTTSTLNCPDTTVLGPAMRVAGEIAIAIDATGLVTVAGQEL